jgi:uncharacterized protein
MVPRIGVFAGDKYHRGDIVREGLSPQKGFEFDFGLSLHDLTGYQAIVLAKANHRSHEDESPWVGPDDQVALETFVGGQRGLLVIHSGTVGYEGFIREATGGHFRSHPEPCQVEVKPTGLDSFEVFDEHYQMEFVGGDVFAIAKSEHGEQPAGWRRLIGKGRISVLTPGHYAAVWAHPRYQAMLSRELDWVVNGNA